MIVEGRTVASKGQVSLFARLLGADGFPELEATVDAVANALGYR